jgi:hypothetical protein
MTNDSRLPGQSANDLVEVVRDLPDALVGKNGGMNVPLLDAVGVVGPTGRERSETRGFEHLRPAIPTARQQPQAMNEDDGRQPRRVRARHLNGLVLGYRRDAGGRRTLFVSGAHFVPLLNPGLAVQAWRRRPAADGGTLL